MKITRTLVCAGASALLALGLPAARAEENAPAEEKALEQSLSASEPVETGHTEISHGHVDMGPTFVDGKWELMFHDDHGTEPVWRLPEDVVLKGGDSALLPKPDDPRYDFVSADAGEEVYVIPQTEAESVVWPGWNTQDPEVLSRLDQGVTFTLDKVEGPGQFSLYLENGNFSEPEVLWSSDKSEKQDIFVEPNTHTHANWVFTEPGAYFLTVTVHADLADGSHVTDTERLQFAVGDSVSADQVFEQAAGKGPVDSAGSADAGDGAAAASDAEAAASEGGLSTTTLAVLIALALLVLAALGFLLVRRGQSARSQAESELK